MMIRIAFAARDLGDFTTGVQKNNFGYIQSLLPYKDQYEIHLYYSQERHLGLFPELNEHCLASGSRLLWDHLLLPVAMKRDGIDVAIFPKGTKPLITGTRDLVIMNDLGYFYPHLNAYKTLDTYYMRTMMRFSARHAWGVFTISEATRKDVIKFLIPKQKNKVHAIYCAPIEPYACVGDEAALRRIQETYRLQTPFIFYPTSISPRKNLHKLLDAWDLVRDQIPHHLYLTGGTGWKSEDVIARLQDKRYERIHRLGRVEQADLPGIYSLSDFVVYISIFEGFGLPLVEAMRCEKPVLASNVSSIPEVTGDAALLVDPYSAESIAEGMLRLAGDAELKQELVLRGVERVKNFTWERTGAEMISWIETHL